MLVRSRILGVQIRAPMAEEARHIRLANSQFVAVTHKTVPLKVSLSKAWGGGTLVLRIYAVMPVWDQVVIVGRVTLGTMGISSNDQLDRCAQEQRNLPVAGRETSDFDASCICQSRRFKTALRG